MMQVELGNPNVVWSASEDGTLRQHDFREGASCPPAGSSNQDCCNVLVCILCFLFCPFSPVALMNYLKSTLDYALVA